MSTIIDYKVITSRTGPIPLHERLETKVAVALKEGWQPLGGVVIHPDFWAQTMVRYEKK
jgi:Domain of unknown function (DUF1737)